MISLSSVRNDLKNRSSIVQFVDGPNGRCDELNLPFTISEQCCGVLISEINRLFVVRDGHMAVKAGSSRIPSAIRVSEEQENHLRHLRSEVVARMDEKYRRGAVEHGGNIWDKTNVNLLEEAIDEAIDQLTYLLTMRSKAL